MPIQHGKAGLFVAVAALMVAPAQAAPVTEHAPQIRELKSELRQTRASLRRTSRTLRVTRTRLAAAQTQIGELETDLATRTAERDAAVAAGLRPSAVATAVEQVRREVAHVQRPDATWSRQALIAHAAMNYVTGHVSAPAYGFMNAVMGTSPLPNAESVLQAGAGICGHAALTFAAIVRRFDIPVRSVQFYYADGINNHIADEVYYDGAWHYFDPTWGAFYSDGLRVLSITEARERTDARSLLHQNDTLFWRWALRRAGVPELGAETDATTRVEIDKQRFPA